MMMVGVLRADPLLPWRQDYYGVNRTDTDPQKAAADLSRQRHQQAVQAKAGVVLHNELVVAKRRLAAKKAAAAKAASHPEGWRPKRPGTPSSDPH